MERQVVSAGVGFNVQRSESVAYRSSTTVPSGACWSIRAYNVFFEYGFEVWQEPFIGPDRRIGSGSARDFRGIRVRLLAVLLTSRAAVRGLALGVLALLAVLACASPSMPDESAGPDGHGRRDLGSR